MNRNKKGQVAPKSTLASTSRNGNVRNQRQMVSAPVSKFRLFKKSEPQFTGASSNGDIRVKHREYFADLAGSVAFASNTYAVNPGLSSMFPWLSQLASRYEMYRFNSLKFSYETESATTATGTVLLVLDTDAADPAPVSKSDALSYAIKNRAAPWEPFDLVTPPVADSSGVTRKFIRQGNLAANLDIKTYDVGNLFACTLAQATGAVVGELYVEYDISLYTPQVSQSSPYAAKSTGTAGLTATKLFGTDAVVTGSLPITINAAGDTITFNAQCELLLIGSIAGTVLSGTPVNSGTCTSTMLSSVYNSGATLGSLPMLIRASPGQTLILAITATTVSSAVWRSGGYQYSLA